MRPMRRIKILVFAIVATLAAVAARSRAADSAAGLASWFETVAEAERLSIEESGSQQNAPQATAPSPGEDRPGAAVGPASMVDPDALRGLIDRRNRLVNERLFATVKKLSDGRRPTEREIKLLQEWLTIYFQMRALMPASRQDPNLEAASSILEEAIRRRDDFVEGRVLVALCHLYAGRPDDARRRLDEASKNLFERLLNPFPFGQDCCLCWLLLGEPSRVTGYIAVLKDKKKFPPRIMTSFHAALVAIHGWQTFRFNEAEDYFDKSLQKADAFKSAPTGELQGLIADAALFYFLAGNEGVRDGNKGEKLLAMIPEENRSWRVRRARAALNAWRAATADGGTADGLWEAAVRELEACRQDSLPILDAEIDAQLDKYRKHEAWFRERPKTSSKAA